MRTPSWDDLQFSDTTGILQQKKTMWFIGVEVEQVTSAPPPKKNPGSAPVISMEFVSVGCKNVLPVKRSQRRGARRGGCFRRPVQRQ